MALTITDAELLMLPIAGEGAIVADPAIQQRVELDHRRWTNMRNSTPMGATSTT